MANIFMSPGALLILEWKLGWIGEKTKQNFSFLVWFRHLALTLYRAKVIQSNKKDESWKWQKEILTTIVIKWLIIIIMIMAIIWKYTKHDKITKWKNEKTK